MRKILLLFLINSSLFFAQISESFENTFPPQGWSVNHISGTSDWVQISSNYRTGSKCASSNNPASNSYKSLILNLNVSSGASTITYYVSVSSITTGTGATLTVFAGTSLDNMILLRTINLENLSPANTYFGFTDYIDGTNNQSGNAIDLRNTNNCFISWVHNKTIGTAASCRLDDIEILNATPLPVQLTSFTAGLYDNKVKLNWSTATEVNNYGFEIERNVMVQQSYHDNWEKIGFVQGHGNSNSPKDYTFIDTNLQASKVQYRLKQIDYDGTFEYSNIAEVNVDFPNSLMLEQNYPNPFNPETNISYKVPIESFVTLKIYDMLGNEVTTLVNEHQKQGTYNAKFRVQNSELSSGVYFYKLQAGNFIQIRKMILMK